jgi:hypothetical protein
MLCRGYDERGMPSDEDEAAANGVCVHKAFIYVYLFMNLIYLEKKLLFVAAPSTVGAHDEHVNTSHCNVHLK